MIRAQWAKGTITRAEKGLSLIELLVAMALGTLLLLAVVSIYTNTKQTYSVLAGQSRLQENVRFAMARLTSEIGAAGYLGCLQAMQVMAGEPVILNAMTVASGVYNFVDPVTGRAGVGKNDSDEITVIRAIGLSAIPLATPMASTNDSLTLDADHPEYAKISQGDVVIVADCSRAVAFMVTNHPTAGDSGELQHGTGITIKGRANAANDLQWIFGLPQNSQAVLMRVAGNVYSIGNSVQGVCRSSTPGFCSLRENGHELVRGVQRMTILYGLDMNADTVVDQYVGANAVADWGAVVSVRITLVVNEVERVQGSNNGVTSGVPKIFINTIRVRSRGV